jgi:hypothetical protein
MIDLKKIKPIGVVVILGLSLLAFIMCLTVNLGVPKKYESRHDTAYYKESTGHMEELLSELKENVLPQLDGIQNSYYSEETGHIVIVANSRNYDKAAAVIKRDFDASLFDFQKF